MKKKSPLFFYHRGGTGWSALHRGKKKEENAATFGIKTENVEKKKAYYLLRFNTTSKEHRTPFTQKKKEIKKSSTIRPVGRKRGKRERRGGRNFVFVSSSREGRNIRAYSEKRKKERETR